MPSRARPCRATTTTEPCWVVSWSYGCVRFGQVDAYRLLDLRCFGQCPPVPFRQEENSRSPVANDNQKQGKISCASDDTLKAMNLHIKSPGEKPGVYPVAR